MSTGTACTLGGDVHRRARHRLGAHDMLPRRVLLALFACCALGLAVSTALGVGYSERHSSHEGFFRVPVADAITGSPDLVRPRRTVIVVFDGLGYLEAEDMPSFQRLRALGRCDRTDVGELSVSRPVYAVLSTGLEQDRTGVRGNDDTHPLAADSVWQIAREAGLTVSAVSELPWWRELFPRGFDAYAMPPRDADYFDAMPPADVQLVHPIYVDELGHEFGAGSSEYRAGVARADRELSGLLDTIDFERDLVIATADHGHSLRGGHGGAQDRVRHVLTCHAGAFVRHRAQDGQLRETTIGPSIALLLGLRFPSNMRAGDDDLDALWDIPSPSRYPAAYLAERRATVDRFRLENEAQLRRWDPASEGSWRRFRARHQHTQILRTLPLLFVAVLVLVAQASAHRRWARSRRLGRMEAWVGLALVSSYFAGMFALQIGLRGSFDLSSVASADGFITFTLAMSFCWSAVAIALHLFLWRDLGALLIDWTALCVVGTLFCVAHPLAVGWHVEYPVPSPEVYFFPWFATLALGVVDAIGMVLCAYGLWRTRDRDGQRSDPGP